MGDFAWGGETLLGRGGISTILSDYVFNLTYCSVFLGIGGGGISSSPSTLGGSGGGGVSDLIIPAGILLSTITGRSPVIRIGA